MIVIIKSTKKTNNVNFNSLLSFEHLTSTSAGSSSEYYKHAKAYPKRVTYNVKTTIIIIYITKKVIKMQNTQDFDFLIFYYVLNYSFKKHNIIPTKILIAINMNAIII